MGKQLDCIFRDIYPDAVKIGMVSNQEIIKVIAEKLREYKAENIVIDPVMVATSGSALMVEGAGKTLVEELFPLGKILTPNIPEAEALSGTEIKSRQDMEEAARIISSFTDGAVLVKEAILQTGQMTFSMNRENLPGCQGREWRIPIPTAPAAPFPLPLPAVWQQEKVWKTA